MCACTISFYYSCCEKRRECSVKAKEASPKANNDLPRLPWWASCRYSIRCSGKDGDATCRCSGSCLFISYYVRYKSQFSLDEYK